MLFAVMCKHPYKSYLTEIQMSYAICCMQGRSLVGIFKGTKKIAIRLNLVFQVIESEIKLKRIFQVIMK